MLFGEYIILRGSKSLAFPLKFGQTLAVEKNDQLNWKSIAPSGTWFEAEFSESLELISTTNSETAEILRKILLKIKTLNPSLNLINAFTATADFKLEWGLGSSSTLLSLLAQWSQTDPYILLDESFGGSGYDIACATANSPIIYTIDGRKVEATELKPEITDHFLFVYLGEKQSSRNEIKRFEKNEVTQKDIQQMDSIIDTAIKVSSIEEFEVCLNQAEQLLSPIIGKQTLKEHIFADYSYCIKSLGAWGGDFFLATFRDLDKAKTYFSNKGLTTFFTYNEMVKN